jgi:predicted DCC family thiol-disulfide oxidoreductase YuxK
VGTRALQLSSNCAPNRPQTAQAAGTVTGVASSLVLYDDDCGFCRVTLALILAWDRPRRLRPLALQTPEADRLLEDMSPERRMSSWHLVAPDGRVASAGAAFPPLLGQLPGGAPLGRVSARFPGASERGYRWVADHRSTLGSLLPASVKRWADAVISRRTATRPASLA